MSQLFSKLLNAGKQSSFIRAISAALLGAQQYRGATPTRRRKAGKSEDPNFGNKLARKAAAGRLTLKT